MSTQLFAAEIRTDVIIIGGGVIGLTVARELARRGVKNLTVVEKNEFGREASWAAGGILAPQVEADAADAFFRLACASRDMYRDFADELQNVTGVDVGLNTSGTIFVAFTEAQETAFRTRYVWQKSQGLAIEWLTGDEVQKIEPYISPEVRAALRFPNDFQIDNRKLVEALLVANKSLEVRLIQGCNVHGLDICGGRVCGARTSQGHIKASTAVIAAGAWSSSIDSPETMRVEPVRGQMLCFDAPQFARHVIYSADGYLVPRSDGRLLAGSTGEYVGFDKRVTTEAIDTIRSMAFQIAPKLEDRRIIDSWAGFRPRAQDGLPVLGQSAHLEGLFYATGHYRNGILLAPVTGQLIAEAIVSGTTSPLLDAFLPTRFAKQTVRAERKLTLAGAGAADPA